jgi:two-component system CheB/CheR fusion protein
MLREEWIFEVRSLLQKAKKSEMTVSKDNIYLDSTGEAFCLEIVPIKSSRDFYFLIIFKQQRESSRMKIKRPKNVAKDQQSRVISLEYSLRDSREQIRSITEDFDSSREELQSANEEILSSNEELQSINEELETSKEELQSTNEELITINEELETRVSELKEARDYAEAIIGTMHGPLIVMTSQMRITTANKAFYEFFKLNPHDTEGKHIHDLQHDKWNIPTLAEHVREILPKKVAFKNFEINHNFPGIGNRIMFVNAHKLVHGNGNGETMILLLFQDITRYRVAEENLRLTQEQLKLALEGGSVGTWLWRIGTDEMVGSEIEADLFGLHGRPFFKNLKEWEKSVHPEDLEKIKRELRQSVDGKKPLDTEFRIVWPDNSIH